MLKIFKKYKSFLAGKTKIEPKSKTVNEIIEEIHESFYTEVDRLLDKAKIMNSLYTNKQDLIDKGERLASLGFTNTKEVKEAQTEATRLHTLEQENKSKKTLIDTINYFSFKYPSYKFITEESVKNICNKYNLVYGKSDNYIGNVPDINLKHIEDFKVSDEDECFIKIRWGNDEGVYVTNERYEKGRKHGDNSRPLVSNSYYKKCPLEIVAPLEDFNMKNMELKNHKISKIPDPIVLKPVIFDKQKHYLIVTAWGN